jgi:hypothetical protein
MNQKQKTRKVATLQGFDFSPNIDWTWRTENHFFEHRSPDIIVDKITGVAL